MCECVKVEGGKRTLDGMLQLAVEHCADTGEMLADYIAKALDALLYTEGEVGLVLSPGAQYALKAGAYGDLNRLEIGDGLTFVFVTDESYKATYRNAIYDVPEDAYSRRYRAMFSGDDSEEAD